MPKEAMSEAHLPAERPQAREATRLSSPHVDTSGPSGDPKPPAEGPRSAVRVTRMRGRASFLDLRRNGVRGRMGPLTVTFVASGDELAEVGYAISRRVGNAVVRNRLRRRLRSAIADLSRAGKITLRGGRYLISPKSSATQLSFAELGQTLHGALEQAWGRATAAGVR